jgi:hypothetical protein
MIRHCVWVKFRPDVPQAERRAIYDQLTALRDHLKGIVAMSFGPNVSPEGLQRGFTDGFTIDFTDADARDAYLADDAHGRAGARLVTALDGGRDGLIVFDIEV